VTHLSSDDFPDPPIDIANDINIVVLRQAIEKEKKRRKRAEEKVKSLERSGKYDMNNNQDKTLILSAHSSKSSEASIK
jgi:hypothetical protein